jgi:hypothetical protein
MKENEFTELFKGTSEEEFSRFGSFLISPFFKVPKRIVKLYELIQKYYNGSDYNPVTREMISRCFYPGKKYSETQVNIRKLISEFKDFFNRFLSQREFEDREFEQKLLLLKQLRKKQRTKAYKRFLGETKGIIKSDETKDEEHFRKLLDLSTEQYLFEGYHYKHFDEDLSFEISEYLDLYFIAYKLFLFQRLEAREYVLKTNIHKNPKFYDAVFKEIENNIEHYKNYPEIYCRYLMLKMNKNPDSPSLYDEYLKYLDYTEEEMKINCYSYYQDLLSHCIRMVNYGKTEFEKRIVEFAGIMESKSMFEKYGISNNDLKIIIECSIGTGKYGWGEEFVKRNIKYAEELSRENIYNLGIAKIYFFNKQYSQSREHLVKVSYEDYVHYVDAKLIEVRIEYEEKCFVELLSIIQTVKKFLKSHTEIGDIYRKSYLAFANFLNRLVKIYESSMIQRFNDYDIRKLKEDISSYPNLLYGVEWLLDKISEIEKGRL